MKNMIKRFINWIKKEDFWDLMAWASLAMIFFWALAKSFGWINTPNVIEMLPYFGIVFFVGRIFQKMETSEIELRNVKSDTEKIKQKLHTHDLKFVKIENKLNQF